MCEVRPYIVTSAAYSQGIRGAFARSSTSIARAVVDIACPPELARAGQVPERTDETRAIALMAVSLRAQA